MIKKLLCFVLVFGCLNADSALLKESDISRIMGEIFKQHVDKKSITASIIKNGFKNYISQFDRNHIYLLEDEVRPFFTITDNEAAQIIDEYKAGNYSYFVKMNDLIARAIERSRAIRQERKDSWMRSLPQVVQQNDKRYPENYGTWAANTGELTKRLTDQFYTFILNYSKRYGKAAALQDPSKLFALFDLDLKNKENSYLYIDDEGVPLSVEEKENLFSLHVLKALASSLDSHTRIYNPSEAYDMKVRLEKGFDGVGVVLEEDGKQIKISEIIPGSSAEKNGELKAGDELREVNGESVAGKSFSETLKFIRQQTGNTLSLTVQRGGKLIKVNLLKQEIHIDQDRLKVSKITYGNGIIGVIKLDSFYQSNDGISSEKDLREAFFKLEKENNLRGLILDFRDNSGGFLNQAVKVAGLFITDGVVVISKYSNGEEKVYRDMDANDLYDGPLVILTSRLTASAAEIVAQSLQDYGVALIVGDDHTYGKGTIQSQTVTDGKDVASYFKVTVGKYYTVSGKTPQLKGVQADIVVPGLLSAQEIGEEYLERSSTLPSDTIASVYNDSLKDIEPSLKSWYMKYYIPNIQRRELEWRSLLPELKKNSASRIFHNHDYQFFLKSLSENPDEPDDSADYQLDEAVNIVKDMIYLQSKIVQRKRAGVPIK